MKKAVFLAFSLLTCYLAAMYRSRPLMLLFLTELFLAVCMRLLVYYLKRCLTVTFPKRSIVKEAGVEHWYDCDMINKSRLPVSHCRIRMRMCYLQETEAFLKTSSCGRHRPRRSKETVNYLYGTSESGTNGRIHFGVRALYCGMVCLAVDRIRVYDYLALFSGTNRLRQDRRPELRIAILPPGKPLYIEISSFEWGSGNAGQEKTARYSSDAAGEIRQTHEYRAGDSCRHIHWKQSARTDRIWIKEYEKEINFCMDLVLEIHAAQWFDPKRMDAFYRLLYSVILGLLEKEYRVKLHWFDGHPERLMETEIREEGQCQDMFLRLFQTDFSRMHFSKQQDGEEKTLRDIYSFTYEHYFKLDTGLGWYLDETLIYRFSCDDLEKEITEMMFIL